ncbi:MAG: ankyrin repeat domain-containing protein [Bythopirellula sp.]|nr:ankyrin repeat domain-containing protein [Bythopirellula sp.]
MAHDIFWAVKEGTVADVRDACQTATDVNAVDREGCTALYHAVVQRDLEKAKFLLEKGASPVAVALGRMHRSAFNKAAELGYLEVVETILNAGIHPDTVGEEDAPTPLMYAALKNRVEVMQLLLSRGANPNYKSVDRLRPIDYTTGIPNLEAYEILLPLTDRWYRKTAKKNLEQRQWLNAQRAAQNMPEKKAEQERKYQEFVEKQENEGTLTGELQSQELSILMPMAGFRAI